jgi:hypothetical protein
MVGIQTSKYAQSGSVIGDASLDHWARETAGDLLIVFRKGLWIFNVANPTRTTTFSRLYHPLSVEVTGKAADVGLRVGAVGCRDIDAALLCLLKCLPLITSLLEGISVRQ